MAEISKIRCDAEPAAKLHGPFGWLNGCREHCARLAGNTKKLEMIAELREARRCKTNIVGAAGECLVCDAEQGESCRG